MSAAGDAVLAEARRWIGTTEQPPGSNAGPWWDAFGANYGSWCAAFVSMVVNNALGPGAMCQVDSSAGFMLVSNGSVHAYQTGDGGSPTGLEAQRTPDLQPGDVVNYSWEAWRWEGQPGAGGYPVCDGGSYDGWAAGDHTGIAASAVDGAGYFRAVEGNTSDSDSGSQDNGGGCYEKTRHISQVCGWWRPINYGAGAGPGPGPAEEDEDDDMMRYMVRAEDGSAYAVDGIKAYPIASAYTVQVLQACGALMTREQMNAKGWTVDVDGGSINAAFEIQRITEHTPDQA